MSSESFGNIAAYLPAMAKRQPDTVAVYCPVGRFSPQQRYSRYTYAELDCQSNRMAAVLAHLGIGRGVRTVLMVTPSLEFFALTFALFKVGAVPVLVDPGMGTKNLKTCLAEAQPTAFIGIPKAHLARRLLGWARSTLTVKLTTGPRLWFDEHSLPNLLAGTDKQVTCTPIDPASDETAAILFTSGSTGVPKGVVYTHQNFIAQVQALKDIYQIQPGEIDLPTFPLFALFAPALGMTAVIPQMDFARPGEVDPQKIISAIKRFEVTTMFGSPALIRRVAVFGNQHGVTLPTLKRAISAGAPVAATTLVQFSRLLTEDARIFTPYGATEALPVCSIDSATILGETRQLTDQGHGVCVGRPVPGVEVGVIPICDEAIDPFDNESLLAVGRIGEIIVTGQQVTRSYFNRAESTRLAKIADPANQRFFHRMGDLGYRDVMGRIWFCGRKSHRVITEQETLFTIPCEGVFNTHPQVFRTALVGVESGGKRVPLICVELEAGIPRAQHQQIILDLRDIAAKFPHTTQIERFLIHPAFPVDIRHNAKIFREKLAVWAQQQLTA
ncbi:fatty acid CoA ligase family protein [Pelovirga terrestris]|uniref:AMP-binding protein n=1 Tax=Pelovirga terrestris TaxID=2771352 RepID=A0A8J6UKA3_9BACT|nr:fatty acid CoA ligase family protein [Pelovirga terrestris]MBD1399137.1 AMP-binding protein [Pelovirga terrestris]